MRKESVSISAPSKARSESYVWVSLLAVFLPFAVLGDDTRGVTDAIAPPAVELGAPAGSYALSGFESVNLYSGKLHFALPLHTVGGRGEAGYTIMLPIDRGWQVKDWLDAHGNPTFNFYALTNATPRSHVWSDTPPPLFSPGIMVKRRSAGTLIDCGQQLMGYQNILTRLTFISADGSETQFVDQPTGGQPWGGCTWPPNVRPGPYVSRDGSAMTFYPNPPMIEDTTTGTGFDQGVVSGALHFRDGRKHQITNGRVTSITDRNGNTVSLGYDSTYSRLEWAVDPLGRTVSFTYSSGADEVRWIGNGGTVRKVTVRYSLMESALASGYYIQGYADLLGPYGGSSNPFNPVVVSSVELPDGRSYTFKYNSHGELAEVRLPTGGAYRYQWDGGGVYNGGRPYISRHPRALADVTAKEE